MTREEQRFAAVRCGWFWIEGCPSKYDLALGAVCLDSKPGSTIGCTVRTPLNEWVNRFKRDSGSFEAGTVSEVPTVEQT